MDQELPDPVTTILRERDGVPTVAVTAAGRRYLVHNIAWGRDMGETRDHITTNISPGPSCEHDIDFFKTGEIVALLAAESGAVLYRAPGGA